MTGRRGQRPFTALVAGALVALAAAPAALGAGPTADSRMAPPIRGVFLALLTVANDDSYAVTHDRTLVVAAPGVLKNDLQLELLGSDHDAVLVTDAAHGNLDLRADGGFTYTPDAAYVGPDSFRYKVVGALLESNTAKVMIDVTNTAPVAVDDSYSAVTGVKLVVPAPGVLANDHDDDVDDLTASLVDGGGNGSLSFASDGSFTFKSGGSFTGIRTFTYRVSDGVAWSNIATVSITVSAAASTPSPTPTASPTPTPTPLIALPTLALPTLLPTPTPTPTATPVPGATASPRPSPTATPSPSAQSSPEATTTPTQEASPTPSSGSDAADAPGVGGARTGDGTGGGAAPGDRFVLPAVDPPDIDAILDASFSGFSGVEWAVPAFALGVPGLLLMLAVGAQTVVGAAWLPFVRRWLGGLGVRRHART